RRRAAGRRRVHRQAGRLAVSPPGRPSSSSRSPSRFPGAGEVVVDIIAAALNRRDPWIWRTPGYCPLPVTLGSDGAGIVSAVGSGADAVGVGTEVCIDSTLGWG